MSSHNYQDELIFSFDDPLDISMGEESVNEQNNPTSYQYPSHGTVVSEEIYLEHNDEDNRLCYFPNSILNCNFNYIISPPTNVQDTPIITDIIEGIITAPESTMSLDYTRNLSRYFIGSNPLESACLPSKLTDVASSSIIESCPINLSNSIYIPHTFDAKDNDSFSDQNLYSPTCSFGSTVDSQYSPCDYDSTVMLPNSPPQTDYDVSVPSEGQRKRINNIKQLTCDICNRCFGRPQEVIRHQVCHTREKKFWCIACDKKFARRDALLRHTRSHSKLKVKNDSSVRVAK